MDTSLDRPKFPLGIAGGLAVSLAFVAIAFLHHHAPEPKPVAALIATPASATPDASAEPPPAPARKLHESSLCPAHWGLGGGGIKPTDIPRKSPSARGLADGCWNAPSVGPKKPMRRPAQDRSKDWSRWITEAEESRTCAEWAFRLELATLADCRRLERIGRCAERHPPLGSEEHLRCQADAFQRLTSLDADLTEAEKTRIDEAFKSASMQSLGCLRDNGSIDAKALHACIVTLYERAYPRDL